MPRVETKRRLSLTKGWGLALFANINICVESLKYDVFPRVEVLNVGGGEEKEARGLNISSISVNHYVLFCIHLAVSGQKGRESKGSGIDAP